MTKAERTRLKSARTVARLTRAQLAVELGVDPSTVARWETGVSDPTPLALAAIRRRFPGVISEA